MAAIQSQDEKAALAAGKKPTLTGISSSPTTKPTPVASLGDGTSFRLPVPTGQGQEKEVAAGKLQYAKLL